MWWGKLVRIDSYTSLHIISICRVLCRKENLATFFPDGERWLWCWRFAQSLLSGASFLYLFLSFIPKEDYDQCDLLWLREVWHIHFLDGQSARDFTKPTEPTVFQSVASRHLWILLPTLRLHICSRQDFQRADHGNWCTTEKHLLIVWQS